MFSGIGTAEKGIEQAYEGIKSTQFSGQKLYRGRCGDSTESRFGQQQHISKPICIGFAEIDRFASSIYKYHWPDVRNYGDATKIICDELPDFDFLVGGFPCQAFSIAGKRKGFQDTRGTLFFEIARILESKRPRHFLLENVAGLLSHDNGQTFRTIIATLDEIGYDTEWTLINSKHHGVPQNRERVFIVGHSSGCGGGEILSFGDGDGEFDEIQRTAGIERQWLSVSTESPQRDQSCLESWRDGRERHGDNGIMQLNDPTHSNNRVYSQDGASPALNTAQGGNRQPFVAIPVLTPNRPTKRQNGRRMKEQGEARFTLTAQDRHGVMVQAVDTKNVGDARFTDNVAALGANDFKEPKGVMLADRRIRRLTPTECERLQGLPDGHTALGIDAKGNVYEVSDSQRYKTLGNAMTVNVIEAIVTRMLEKGCLE